MKDCALITGASGGLGLEFAKLFAKDKTDVLLVARNGKKLEELKIGLERDYGAIAHIYPADLTEEASADKIYDFAKGLGLNVCALVNNAGFGDYGAYAETDWRRQSDMVKLNVTALMHLTRLFLPDMLKNGAGGILNVASIAAFQPGPLMSVYYATKAFVLSFSEALARETKNSGVTVTALCPGPIYTGFEEAASLQKSGLFKNVKPTSPEKVAAFGYKKFKKGKAVAVHGLSNRFMVFSTRLVSRATVRNVVYKIMKEKP